ncbi:MAG: ribonuclease P protein component [Acidobacteria bacterium]|nr:ribonuclease P protein component [Acidobacteriota bacterium]
MSQTFGRESRLRTRTEFTAVQEHGRRIATRWFVLLGVPNVLGRDRLGIIASRRIGGAVVRNRAKRRLREVFRHRPSSPTPLGRTLDLVVIARRELATAPWQDVESEFAKGLARLRSARVT